MKKFTKGCLIAAIVFAFNFPMIEQANAIDFSSLLKSIQNTMSKSNFKKLFCRKGDTYKKISVRSASGFLCNFRIVAALSQYVCRNPNVEGFEGSGCDTKGENVLGIKHPTLDQSKKILIDEAKKGGEQAKALLCSDALRGRYSDNLNKIADQVCPEMPD